MRISKRKAMRLLQRRGGLSCRWQLTGLICLGMLIGGLVGSVQSQDLSDPPCLPDDRYEAIFGAFENRLTNTSATSETMALSSGGGSGATAGGIQLSEVSFGQTVGRSVPYKDFRDDFLEQARSMLYYDVAQAHPKSTYTLTSACFAGIANPFGSALQTLVGQEFFSKDALRLVVRSTIYGVAANVSEKQVAYAKFEENLGEVESTEWFVPVDAAFLYKYYLYTKEEVDPGSGGEDRNFTAQLENMEKYWPASDIDGDGSLEDREYRAKKAMRYLKHVLKYEPRYEAAQDALLDIYYNRAVAYNAMGRQQKVEAAKYAVAPDDADYLPAEGEFTIMNESAALTKALPSLERVVGAYFELLFDDHFGLSPERKDALFGNADEPLGSLLFRDAQPHRALMAPTCFNENDELEAILDELDANGNLVAGGDGEPDQLTDGYKDLVLLFDTERDAAQVAAQAAKLYALMGGEYLTIGKNIVASAYQKRYTEGNLWCTFLPAEGWDNPELAASGVGASKAGWVSGVSDLAGVKRYLEGSANPLGLSKDFLALVQTDIPGASGLAIHKNSFDYFAELLLGSDGSSPGFVLAIADDTHETAKAKYQTFKFFRDEIEQELISQRTEIEARLREIAGAEWNTPDYDSPYNNKGGELYEQGLKIEQVQLQIDHKTQEIRNVEAEIQSQWQLLREKQGIYNEMKDIRLNWADKQYGLTMGIAGLDAIQKSMEFQISAEAADKEWTKFGLYAFVAAAPGVELAKGALEGAKERLAALEEGEILDQEGQMVAAEIGAIVRTLYRDRLLLELDALELSNEALQMTSQLAALDQEKQYLEAKWMGADDRQGARYFADPAHRVVMDQAFLAANFAFRKAQWWVYVLARALEYKHNIQPVYAPSLTDSQIMYTPQTAFRLRNADELVDMAQALFARDQMLGIGLQEGLGYVRLSLREDILGYRTYASDGQIAYYDDPVRPNTGTLLTAEEAFRRYVKEYLPALSSENLQDFDRTVRFTFSTLQTSLTGTFFSTNRWNEKIKRILIKIKAAPYPWAPSTMVYLEQSGIGYLRTLQDPITKESVLRAYPVKLWAEDQYVPGSWYGQDRFGVTFPALISADASLIDPALRPAESDLDIYERREFHERPAAISRWILEIPLSRNGYPLIDLKTLTDIELWFSNYSNG